MKLRLETGNFKITGTVDAETQTIIVNDLPKGLTSEDLIGCIVDIDINGLCVVTNTIPHPDGKVSFGFENWSMTYDPTTGKVTSEE